MSQYYISKPDEWKMVHIPFTPYYLARGPDTRLWRVVEKELTPADAWSPWEKPNPPYSYRFL